MDGNTKDQDTNIGDDGNRQGTEVDERPENRDRSDETKRMTRRIYLS